ncbi:uncharacterized protein LOC111664032 [Seriola lalandi dorsalis]|uniref:Chromosome 4 open reading frame 54 n=1 Tax=Seriola lalandi dorsalis TaxID=1841481 RepID=A0A3B4WQ34_SERLL|nr:uncharacterized protein LOC111664032 [Seriola lalandi dorsalis]XP_056228191.1 uncharacterized protein C4orf54-like [Seriola aureovittata]
MEAAEETLTYLDDTGLHRKLLPEDKDKDNTDSRGQATETKSEESNYVDLDMKPDGARTVKVTFTGEGNQLSVIKYDSSKQGTEDKRASVSAPVSGEPPLETLTKLPNTDPGSENDKLLQTELDPSDCSEHVCSESDELQYTDMYLNSKTESDDGVLSDHCGSDTVEDESHYITTHEIQLTELDHDVDYDLGRGTCWDFEDDNLVYSFVDYASFESDETQEGTLILEGRSQAKVQSNLGGAVVSTEQEEDSDLCDSDKCASSDESVCKNQICGDENTGKIHLSIKTSSRAVNEPVGILDNSTCSYTKHFGDRSHFSFVSSGARAGPSGDRAQYFIPAPGRQHLATKLRRKDINEYSSGASSSISELDDADKEVRNLTAKSFRSLACPYFDAINLSTSSESSMSEYGLNKWSAYVDWNYGNISRGRERSVIAHKTSSARLEMNKTVESKRHGKSALNKRTTSQQSSSSSKKVELKDPVQQKQRGVTLNFRCNVEAPEGTRRPKCSKNTRSNEVTGRSGSEMQSHQTDSMGDTHKRAIFASSLLKNVISKKMQFEQERKMERGELCDTYPALSPDRGLGRGLQRQTSESGSGFTVNSADDQHLEGSRPSSYEPAEEQKSNKAPDDSEKGQHEPPKAALSHSQSSAFNSLKVDEPEPVKEAEPTAASDAQTTAKEDLDTSSMLTKLVFVPSCRLLSKEKDFTEDLASQTPVTDTPAVPQKSEKEFKTGNNGKIIEKEENEKGGKTPEIKICLRSVKENKGCTLNIANLLTPKISYNTVNTFRAAGDAKYHILSATDKIPNFTVRDIRDTKCQKHQKFQTPIYHVRDVRKLVKSSYLGNSDSKCSTAAEKPEEKAKKEPVKHVLPSPIVIKCHSVKTNVKSQKQEEEGVPSETSQSENAPPHCMTSMVPPIVSKQLHPDQSETQPNTETKLTKQRQDKFTGETVDRRNEPTVPKQAALEKLKAAVKTMEQLYVFDRNEWKRKTQAPQPIRDSHVLSLIAREEQGAEELETANTDRIPRSLINSTETGRPQEGKGTVNIVHVPYNDDTFKTQSQQSKTFSNRSVLHFGNSSKAHVSISSVSNSVLQSPALQTPSTMKSSKTPVTPLSVKIEPPKHGQVEQGKVKISASNPTVTQGCSDSENYLTIPGLGYTNEIKLLNREPVSKGNSNVSQAHTSDSKMPEQKRSPLILEYPATSIYHHSAAAATTRPQTQQQVLCFSPTVSPTSPTGETVPQTQRKMLLDPTTGHYYLVDTPLQATTKRLFDPETGQYLDVPMPHSPVAPIAPVPPVPLSLSPLTLSPGAYAPTYMIYPSFIPSPTLPAQAVFPQSPCHAEDAGGDKVKNAKSPRLESKTTGAESAYYSATGEAPHLPVSLGHVTSRGSAASSERKPVISITTQQGPRIIAPPSFDGTTMSFVVEHR